MMLSLKQLKRLNGGLTKKGRLVMAIGLSTVLLGILNILILALLGAGTIYLVKNFRKS